MVNRGALLFALSVEEGAATLDEEEVVGVATGGLVVMVVFPSVEFPEAAGVAHSSTLKSTHEVL